MSAQHPAEESEDDGAHRSRKNNMGHINNAHHHLLNMTPEGMEPSEWTKIVAAFNLLGSIRDERGYEPRLMEQWDDRAPRRFRCDTCSAVFLTRKPVVEPEDQLMISTENPSHCPFCKYGTPELVEGRSENEVNPDP